MNGGRTRREAGKQTEVGSSLLRLSFLLKRRALRQICYSAASLFTVYGRCLWQIITLQCNVSVYRLCLWQICYRAASFFFFSFFFKNKQTVYGPCLWQIYYNAIYLFMDVVSGTYATVQYLCLWTLSMADILLCNISVYGSCLWQINYCAASLFMEVVWWWLTLTMNETLKWLMHVAPDLNADPFWWWRCR